MTTTNRWVRRLGSAIARLNLHRLLQLEPPEFEDHHHERLRHIEGWQYRQDLALLYLLARDIRGSEAVLEIGSYRGLSTTALALGVRDAVTTTPLHAVDPHTPATARIWSRAAVTGSPAKPRSEPTSQARASQSL